MVSEISEKTFSDKHIKEINRMASHGNRTANRPLHHHHLNEVNLHVVGRSDSSLASNPDLSTQLEFIILLTNVPGSASVLHFNSYKSKSVARSVLSGETHAFADVFDAAFSIRHELQRILSKSIKLTMLTDGVSLFKVLLNSKMMSERRLMIDNSAARQAYESGAIDYIGWNPNKVNAANVMTKMGLCDELKKFLQTHVLHTLIKTVLKASFVQLPLNSEELTIPLESEPGECESGRIASEPSTTIGLQREPVVANMITVTPAFDLFV